MVTRTVHIRGMTCAACVAHVTDAITSVPGVESADVSLATNSANVNFAEPASLSDERDAQFWETISNAVKEAGYAIDVSNQASAVDGSETVEASFESRLAAQKSELLTTRNNAVISVSIAALIMLSTLARSIFAPDIPSYALNLLFLAIATPVQVMIARPFYVSAWSAAKRKTSNMNTLIVVGTSVAFAYSALVTITQLISGDSTFWSDAASFVAPGHHTGTTLRCLPQSSGWYP